MTNTQDTKKKVGPIVSVLAVVLILIIAALYLFASKINREPTLEEQAGVVETVQPVTSTSTDVNDLNTDLNAALEGLDDVNF